MIGQPEEDEAMTQTYAIGRNVQEEFLGAVRKGQGFVIEAIQTWADAVQAVTPKLPAVHMPFADRLPKPEDMVGNAFDFAEKLLADQRKFTEDVIKAIAPATPETTKVQVSTPPAQAAHTGTKTAKPAAK
jgi:hypothetical protein